MDIKLVMFKADGTRKNIPLKTDLTIIGRGEDCQLRLPLSSVSRHHCQLFQEDGELMLKDLGSSNGTYVNNHRVTETDLRPGDRLVVGKMIFTVVIDGQPDQIRPAKSEKKKDESDTDIAVGGANISGEFGDEDVLAAFEAMGDDDEDDDI